MNPLVSVRDLAIEYPPLERPVLAGLSFDLRAGERVLLLGPSGCGKSTLALTLNGLIPQSINARMRGFVTVAGLDSVETPIGELCQRVAIVFQDPEAQFCMLTVEDEVAFGLENLRVPREEIGPRVAWALQAVGLSAHRATRLDRLSGGMKQRVALAGALAVRPQVLVLDEPTANLDPLGTRDFFSLLGTLPELNESVILVIEHKLEGLMPFITRTLVLNKRGELLADGEPRAVMRDFGRRLREDGVWIPDGVELGLFLGRDLAAPGPFPLVVNEVDGALFNQGTGASFFQNVGREASEPKPAAPLAVRAERLGFAYQEDAPVLRDVSLEIAEGEFVALLGPNGAGKTTLIECLAGILRPNSGRVELFGTSLERLRGHEVSRFVGFVFQNPEHQFVAQTVFEELAFGLRLQGLPEIEIETETRVLDTLDRFGLRERGQVHPYTLSQGEKRRLSVATMLLRGQRLLILDEPTFGQDRRNAYELMEQLDTLHREGKTILVVTHDLRMVAEFARRAIVLVEGKIIFDGPVHQLFRADSVLAQASLVKPPLVGFLQRQGIEHVPAALAVIRSASLAKQGVSP